MVWQRKKLEPVYDDITPLEALIINSVVYNLSGEDCDKFLNQIKYIKKILRIDYARETITELYVERLDNVPKEYFFSRTEEFDLAKITFKLKGLSYTAVLGMVMGLLFDIRIKPKVEKKIKFQKEEFEVIDIKTESNLNLNTL